MFGGGQIGVDGFDAEFGRETDALRLACGALWNFRKDANQAWYLEWCQASGREPAQAGCRGIRALGEHDRGADFFTELDVRNGESQRLFHFWMGEQNLIDFARRDLLTSAVDDFFEAAGQEEITVCIDPALVAGAKPAICECGLVGLRVVEIPWHNIGPADDHLAGRAVLQ